MAAEKIVPAGSDLLPKTAKGRDALFDKLDMEKIEQGRDVYRTNSVKSTRLAAGGEWLLLNGRCFTDYYYRNYYYSPSGKGMFMMDPNNDPCLPGADMPKDLSPTEGPYRRSIPYGQQQWGQYFRIKPIPELVSFLADAERMRDRFDGLAKEVSPLLSVVSAGPYWVRRVEGAGVYVEQVDTNGWEKRVVGGYIQLYDAPGWIASMVHADRGVTALLFTLDGQFISSSICQIERTIVQNMAGGHYPLVAPQNFQAWLAGNFLHRLRTQPTLVQEGKPRRLRGAAVAVDPDRYRVSPKLAELLLDGATRTKGDGITTKTGRTRRRWLRVFRKDREALVYYYHRGRATNPTYYVNKAGTPQQYAVRISSEKGNELWRRAQIERWLSISIVPSRKYASELDIEAIRPAIGIVGDD